MRPRSIGPCCAAPLLACLGAIVFHGAAPARADDYEKHDFSLRFPAAITRFSPYADVTAVGGASAASTWSSSVNPASTGWRPMKSCLRLSISPQYSLAQFANGTKLHVAAQAVSWDAKKWGTFQPHLAQVRSNSEDTRQGLDFSFDMDYAAFQWGKKIGKDFALGANVNVAKSETEFDMASLDLVKSDTCTYGLRIGGLHEPVDHLLLGVVLDYGFARSRDRTLVPPTFARVTSHDTTQQYVVRPGASFEYKEDSAVYFDYQFGWFDNITGTVRLHRFAGGVDHKVWKWLFVRGGAMVDTRGATTLTGGFGLYPTDALTIDVGFQDNAFPELAPELGRSWLLTLSFGFQF